MTDIAQAILALDSTAQVSIAAEDLDRITWHDGNPNGITAEQITEKKAELVIQAESDATAKADRLVSVKSKLEALGLTTEEIKDAFRL
tara:strand:+ start:1197 stop:1460 length:264 start_codon:yes stop_codon:yes gene_type:complete